MTLQLDICATPEVDKLLLKHNNRPMNALCEALKDKASLELHMAIIMDRRCGIERRTEEEDGPWDLVGASPLIMTINEQRLDVTKALLAAGADPNAQASNGDNSLILAARCWDLEAMELLISYGADINAADRDGNAPLDFAACWGYANLIESLERSGANLEAVDNEGRTPLHHAATSHAVGIIKLLLKLGANQAAVDNAGRTPLHCAAARYNVSVDVIEAFEAFRCNMAAFEANLTAMDMNGYTPLQLYKRSSSSTNDSKISALLTPK